MTDQVPEDYRSFARQIALQFLFQLEARQGDCIEMLEEFILEQTRKNQTKALAEKWIKGTWTQQSTLDALIVSVSDNWKIERLANIDHANLRLGTWQLLNAKEISHHIVIDEAIELAKQFGTEQSPGFINGVLDAVWRKIQGNDFDLALFENNSKSNDEANELKEDF